MDLLLWRHAEAEVAREGQDDLQRQLTGKGELQAQRMARWLDKHLPASTRILASPALRTQQTAQAIGRRFKTVEAIAPGASVDAVLDAANWPQSKAPVLIVGHQPTLGQVVAQLLGGPEQGWSIRKGSVWWLRHRDRDAGAQVVLLTVQSPDLL
jgi:phosphohistidine phosphatase